MKGETQSTLQDEQADETISEISKITKEIQNPNVIIEIEQLTKSINISIISSNKMIPECYTSEFTLDDILKKSDSLNTIKSIDKLFSFLSKLLNKNKFKIEIKDNKYILTFCYVDKMEDIELIFDIEKKELNANEENKKLEKSIYKLSDSINDIKDDLSNIKKLSNLIEEEEENDLEPLYTKKLEDKKLI